MAALIGLALLLSLAGWAARTTQQLHGESMGTTWTVRWVSAAPMGAREAESARVAAAIDDELALLNQQLSAWRPDSALSRFNAEPCSDWQPLPLHLGAVLQAQLDIAARSGGAYDPSVAPLVELWGFGRGRGAAEPTRAALARVRRQVGWQQLEFDVAHQRARKPAGVAIDVSSGGPGYAVDRLSARLDALGLPDHLVELGGELRLRGRRADGQAWQVALESPTHDGPMLTLSLSDIAVGASGDYRDDRLTADGRRIAHFIDPRSGRPVAHPPSAVTVLAGTTLHADAWATAFSVLGPQAGLALAEREGLAVRFLLRSDDGPRAVHSSAFARYTMP